jgi:transposase
MTEHPTHQPPETEPDFTAFIGIDWADKDHQVCLRLPGSKQNELSKLAQTPEAILEWIGDLRRRFQNRPVAVALEQSKGALVYALMAYDFLTLYPVNPAMLAQYRKALVVSRAKDDPLDAGLLTDLVQNHREHLRAWKPDTPEIRRLQLLVEHRRQAVDERSRLTCQLTAALKIHYPQALELTGAYLFAPLALDFLTRWPTLDELKKSRLETIRKFYYAHNVRRPDVVEERLNYVRQSPPLTTDPVLIETYALRARLAVEQLRVAHRAILEYDRQIAALFAAHADAFIFDSFPGSGDIFGPRLLAAFGSRRERFADATGMQRLSGIAPVTVQSGQTHWVHRRWACPRFLKQTFHEYANISIQKSVWARTYYEHLRAAGKGHHAAIRALAFKWIRIMFRCWQDRTAYDEVAYLKALQKRGSYLLKVVPQEAAG